MITPYVRVTFATAKVVLLVGCSKYLSLRSFFCVTGVFLFLLALVDGCSSRYRGVADCLLELPRLTVEDGCPGPLRGVTPGLSGVTIPWALRLSPLHLLPGVEQLVGISLVVEGLAEVVDHRLPYDVLSISLEVLLYVVRLPSKAVSEV